MSAGWSCPACGKAHAPHVLTCPDPVKARYGVRPWPTDVHPPYPASPSVGTPIPPYETTCGSLQVEPDPNIKLRNVAEQLLTKDGAETINYTL